MTARRRILLAAACCAVLPLTVTAQQVCPAEDRAGDHSPPRPAAWSAPRLLWRAFDDSASVHPHRTASDSNQLVVTSEFVFADTSGRRRTEPGAPLAIRVDRRTGRITELRKPHPAWSYTGTHVAIDGRGVAHLLWSEVAGVTVPDTTGGRSAVQIWTARIVHDTVTTPRLVVAARTLQWSYFTASQSLTTDSSGNLSAVLIANEQLTRRPLMVLRQVHDRWRAEVPDMGRLVAVTAVAGAVSGNVLHVVFTSPEISGGAAIFGSVFHASVHLDSARWSPVTLLHDADSTGLAAQHPRISVTPSGETRAIWMVPVDGKVVFGRMDALVSARPPGNSAFGVPHRLAPRAWLHDFESVWTDACNVTHVHARTGAVGATGASTLLDWDGRTWTEHPDFTFNWQYLGRAVVTSPRLGEMTRVWSSAIFGPGLPMILFWYSSELRVGLSSQ